MSDESQAVAAPVDTSPSLESVVGELYGDFSTGFEPEPDAGAPLAETPDAASSEGTEAASVPATDGTAPVPDTGTPDTDTDPLEGASPLNYVVDGQARSYEGITVLKDGGAIIDPEALQKVQTVFSERDHLYEQSQVLRKEHTALQQATAWKSGDKVLQGVEALEARDVLLSQFGRAYAMRVEMMKPENFARYASIAQTGRFYDDGSPELTIVPNEQAVKDLEARIEFLTDKAAFGVQKQYAPIRSQVPQPQAPAPDVPVEQMDLVGTVNKFAQSLGVNVSPDGAQFLAKAIPKYVRATTAEERPIHGSRIVDASFGDLIKREATLASNTAKVADTASAAAKSNQAKLAAASAGRNGTKNPARITQKPDAEPTRADDFDTNYDRMRNAAANAMRATR